MTQQFTITKGLGFKEGNKLVSIEMTDEQMTNDTYLAAFMRQIIFRLNNSDVPKETPGNN